MKLEMGCHDEVRLRRDREQGIRYIITEQNNPIRALRIFPFVYRLLAACLGSIFMINYGKRSLRSLPDAFQDSQNPVTGHIAEAIPSVLSPLWICNPLYFSRKERPVH
jgi:hypothetical protein